jgi:diacylglycerol kinase (ATP)
VASLRVSLIVNPRSGGVQSGAAIEDLLARFGATVRRFELDELERALAAGPTRLVAAAGDGSLGPIAQAAAEHGLELAVLPAGTANDFARAMGIPEDLTEAARLAVTGSTTRAIDLAFLDERPFLNVASAGLSARAARESRRFKPVLGPLAYALGAALAARRAAPLRCRVLCDGGVLYEGDAWQVMVANTGRLGAGGAVETADPRDHRLDAVVLRVGPRLRLARYAYGLRRGRVTAQPGVRRRAARRVEMDAPRDTEYNVDGEVLRRGAAVFTIRPQAARVVVPEDDAGGGGPAVAPR